jgi:hypothetical protein
VTSELLVARGHAAKRLDPGKEAFDLVALLLGRLFERSTAAVVAGSGDHQANPSAAEQFAVGAGEISRIGHDLARPASGPAALTAVHLQAIDQGRKALLNTALTGAEQKHERPSSAIYTHVQLGGEATAAVD